MITVPHDTEWSILIMFDRLIADAFDSARERLLDPASTPARFDPVRWELGLDKYATVNFGQIVDAEIRWTQPDRRYRIQFNATAVGGRGVFSSAIVTYRRTRYYVAFDHAEQRYEVRPASH